MDKSTFKTDSDISNAKFKERELEKWVPESDDLNLSLDDNKSHKHGNWDQFKANQEQFGIHSTYDEHLYTTRVNTEAADYQERLKRAERLAAEIEGSVSSDPHIMEERGKIDDSGIDEEDKYSGVDRSGDKKDTRGDELLAALKAVNLDNKKYVQKSESNDRDPVILSAEPKKNSSGNSNGKSKPTSIPSKPPTHESFRLNAQSEINSLKEFSATFKVPHKIPNDLLPILAKDKTKQFEILKKSESNNSANNSRNSSSTNLATPHLDTAGNGNPASTNGHSPIATAPAATVPNTANPVVKKKMDPTKPAFKLNPKAAVFTPGSAGNAKPAPKYNQHQNQHQYQNQHQNQNQHHQNQHQNHYNRSPNNPSPRMNNQRPYSSVSSNSNSSKRHYQISPSDFFGGNTKIPTKDSQMAKVKKLRVSFNLFITNKNNTPKGEPVLIEKTFITPPTWTMTVDETHDKLFATPEYVQIIPYGGVGNVGMYNAYGNNLMMSSGTLSPTQYPMGMPLQMMSPMGMMGMNGFPGMMTPNMLSPQQAQFQPQQVAFNSPFQQSPMYGQSPPPISQQSNPQSMESQPDSDITSPSMSSPIMGNQMAYPEFVPPGYPPMGFNGGSPNSAHMVMNYNQYPNYPNYQNYQGYNYSNNNYGRRYSQKRG